MTEVVSLVRLLPQTSRLGPQIYEAQFKRPQEEHWKTVGTLTILDNEYLWKPQEDEFGFEDIDVTSRDLYRDFDNRFNAVLFSRYKIRKYAIELIRGQWPPNTVIPPGLAEPEHQPGVG